MVQRKIDFYFPRPPRPEALCGSSFLALPYNIRHRIYLLAGLVRSCPINLNQEGPRAEALRTGAKEITGYSCFYQARRFFGYNFGIDDVPGCECSVLPVSLLYVSRAVSEEVSHILYSENAFTVGRSDLWGLKPLRNMSGRAISSLRCLTVRLNNCECVFGFNVTGAMDMPPCHPLCASHGLHDSPLSLWTRQGNAIVRDWQDLSSKLAAHLQPGQLRLDFVCDTKDPHTSYQIAGALSELPAIRDCSIRLGLQPNWEHHMFSRTTALRLLGKLPSDDHKAYSYYLPSEVLSRILEYSDLVAHYDLECQPDRGFVPFDCCTKCTATVDCCTCSKYHAAYSTSCTCWTPPTSIFLVSRRVHDIAMSIFYGHNRFVLLPKGARLDRFDHCDLRFPQQAPLVQFLRKIPQRAHPLIRFLGLVFPPSIRGSVIPVADGQLAWTQTIDLISQRLDVRRLQLSLYVGSISFSLPTLNYSRHTYNAAMTSKYRPILRSLPLLNNLRDLFIFLEWPNSIRRSTMDAVSVGLEKGTMGANYDSEGRGKWAHPARLWYDGPISEGTAPSPDGTPVDDELLRRADFLLPFEYI